MEKTQPIRLVIADDNSPLHDGLRRFLEREADIEVVGAASDGAEAVRLGRELKPDILTTCVAKPDRVSGFDVLSELYETPVRVILWTAHTGKEFVVAALKLGARGFVFKPEDGPQEVLKAIRMVMAGGYWVHREPFSNRELALLAANNGLKSSPDELRWAACTLTPFLPSID